jgi:hypothetical protein
MLSVTNRPFMPCVIKVNVVMLNIVMVNIVTLNIAAPLALPRPIRITLNGLPGTNGLAYLAPVVMDEKKVFKTLRPCVNVIKTFFLHL